MRRMMVVVGLAVSAWDASSALAAEGYIIGIKPGTKQLAFSEEPATAAKYSLNAEDFEGPIPISDKDGDWLEVVVNDEYLWVQTATVVVSRARHNGNSGATASAAIPGARLHLRAR
jgi:hypothetical protein